MYINDRVSEINTQPYKPEEGQGSDSKPEPDIADADYGERLTKQESYELREDIRKFVPEHLEDQEIEGHQGRITVSDVMQKFGKKCKEGFARDRLNELVEEKVLVNRQIQGGMKVYFLSQSQFQIEQNQGEDSIQEIVDEPLDLNNELNSSQDSQIEIMAELLVKAIDKISELETRLHKLEHNPVTAYKLDREKLLGKLARH